VVVQSTVETLLASPVTDLLRLAVVVPAFAWAAYRDVLTRRVPNLLWLPLLTLGACLLVGDYYLVADSPFRRQWFLIRVAVSLLLVAPLGYVFYRLGGFGGADAKAVMTLALLVPTYPTYFLPTVALPVIVAPLGVFSLTVLSNTVLVGLAYPLVLAAGNLARGRIALPMFVARPVPVEAVATTHGRLMETPDGFTRRGLDLDALRMYLRWRRATLAEVRAAPDRLRDPASLPPAAERGRPGDGALDDGPDVAGERAGALADPDAGACDRPDGADADSPARSRPHVPPAHADLTPAVTRADPWGAAAFIDGAGGAYGTTPEGLRDGLETLAREEVVWVTPGIPFIVPMFVGLVAAFTVGDALYALMRLAGLA
jgi:preflagellin peptidase FlaK